MSFNNVNVEICECNTCLNRLPHNTAQLPHIASFLGWISNELFEAFDRNIVLTDTTTTQPAKR